MMGEPLIPPAPGEPTPDLTAIVNALEARVAELEESHAMLLTLLEELVEAQREGDLEAQHQEFAARCRARDARRKFVRVGRSG